MKYWLFVLATVLGFMLSGCISSVSFTGITPIYPKARGQTVENLQPTLQWKPSGNSNVTYDVIIYEVIVGEERYMAGPVIIQRNNLPASSYKVEKPLKPNTNYFWSVRIRQGNRTSQWSRHNYTLHVPYGWQRSSNQYFTFRTPGLSSN